MKTFGLISFGAALLLAAAVTVSHAQDNSSTTPDQKGNTGWTGGAHDQPSQSGDSQSKSGDTTGRRPPTRRLRRHAMPTRPRPSR